MQAAALRFQRRLPRLVSSPRAAIAMEVVTGAKRRRLEEEQELVADRISGLPDGVLGDIISLLPTKDGARTQALSSRWRHLWRSAPLNLDIHEPRIQRNPTSDISRVLSAHSGPSRRFSIHLGRWVAATAKLDGWLRSPAIDGLRELVIHFDPNPHCRGAPPRTQPLPASVLRFSSTLVVASLEGFVFPDCGNNTTMPLLKQLTLAQVSISEASLHALLAGCPVLESLLLHDSEGFPRLKIVSASRLRSIGVQSHCREGVVQFKQLVIEDAPCLERLLFLRCFVRIDISVVSAPRLSILGKLVGDYHRLRFGATTLKVWKFYAALTTQLASTVDRLTVKGVVPGVRVLAFCDVESDAIIKVLRCFPHLEKLYITTIPWAGRTHVVEKNMSYDKYWKLTGDVDIRLRKIVLPYNQDSELLINFAKFFVRNASMLELMRLEIPCGMVGDDGWITRQHKLLQIEKRASRGARFDFVSHIGSIGLLSESEEQVHDLSKLHPFEMIH